MTSSQARFGAMRAAWKSIECEIAPSFAHRHVDALAQADVAHLPGRAALPAPRREP
jgi:hypothetical protein